MVRFRQKPLRMMWSLEKNATRSLLVGTAHFFPYSFRTSLTRLLKDARAVLFEGPLDETSMKKVVDAGVRGVDSDELFRRLDESAIAHIRNLLAKTNLSQRSSIGLDLIAPVEENSIQSVLYGMKPWMAFFTIYSRFLEKNGWRYSVDMEAYELANKMGKTVVFMESIEDQIEVLETLSLDHIIDFLNRIEHWKNYTTDFVKWYLDGDIDSMYANRYRFPTRNPQVIDQRDGIFYHKMLPYLEHGSAVAFVGAPHVVGVTRMLSADGYEIRKTVTH
jgi:uncharacterized protein YbaP (TraB family)